MCSIPICGTVIIGSLCDQQNHHQTESNNIYGIQCISLQNIWPIAHLLYHLESLSIIFYRYNDPSYVKIKKLEVLTEVCTVNNVQSIMDELM